MCALRQVVLAADRQGFPRERIAVSHQDLGRIEWEGSLELAREQAEHYGLRFEVSRYRDRHGNETDLLEYVRRRGKWPDSANRWCTSEFKRGPGNRVITMLRRERPGHVLQVFGFRAEESSMRAKRPVLTRNGRVSTKKWEVYDWLPIHQWTVDQVWEDIRESGVRHHPAYGLGMSRLSCAFCIFAPYSQLMCAGQHRPESLQEYVDVEKETGHDFQHKKPLKAVQEALARGEKPEKKDDGKWNM